jgi:opacity protein-like surface antigen
VAIDVGYRYRRLWGDFDLDEHQVTAGLRFKF